MNFFLGSNNVMIDLETLSLEPNAFILSIGAVKFYTEIIERFECVIDWHSESTDGFDVDMSTVAWWLKQSNEAREALQPKGVIPMPLLSALNELTDWMGEDPTIWGNGASFDNVVLANAYKQRGISVPWRYTNSLCFRTLRSMFPNNETSWDGVAHSAVDDAEWQARTLINIFRSISENQNY